VEEIAIYLSVIFLSQNYYSISKKIRENTDYLVVLKLRGIRNLNMIVNEYEFIDNKELIKKMYYDATTEKFSYFFVDNINIKNKYRKNLLGKYEFSNVEDEDKETKPVGESQVIITDNVEDVYQSVQQTIKAISDSIHRILIKQDTEAKVFYLADGTPITVYLGDVLNGGHSIEHETFENKEDDDIDNVLSSGVVKIGILSFLILSR